MYNNTCCDHKQKLKNKITNKGTHDSTNKEWASIRASKNEEQEDTSYR